MVWEKAYKNTGKRYHGYVKVNCCKKCNKKTKSKNTLERQIIGNCLQIVAKCLECQDYYITQ